MQVQKVPFSTENAVLTKLTILWILATMLMTFPHGIFPIWRISFPKKVLITNLAYTHFQNTLFRIYILGEIRYTFLSSGSRTKTLKCQYIDEVDKTSIYNMKILLQILLKLIFLLRI